MFATCHGFQNEDVRMYSQYTLYIYNILHLLIYIYIWSIIYNIYIYIVKNDSADAL